jgi:single-strand DNA-binding protein
MANEPVVTIVGNLTADPELRFTGNGHAVANLTVAETPRQFVQGAGWKDGDPLFLRCTIWRDMAENVAETLLMWILKRKRGFDLPFSDVDMSLTSKGV